MMVDRREEYTNLSLMLSRVMDDVGVNEECVLKRRMVNLVRENIKNLGNTTSQIEKNMTSYIFGSQTEGTTTYGLNSDTDILSAADIDVIQVIQDWKDWEPFKIKLLMIRDERTYPGYCKLQLLRLDAALPTRFVIPYSSLYLMNDCDGNVLFRGFDLQTIDPDSVRHGPAATLSQGESEIDQVMALKCCTWPKHYKQWTPDERKRDWPTPEMIHYMKLTGCFVVMAAYPYDDRNETWRISTSLAERCLMFSLNITQIRCYVLLKMIVKTFVSPYLPDTISSYMCKTLLFHCIENTPKVFWKEHNLLQCVHQVLLYMVAAVLDENCPNYFNKAANLFLRKVHNRNKTCLLRQLRSAIMTNGRFLLKINLDQVNTRLEKYMISANLVSVQYDIADKRHMQHEKLFQSFFTSLGSNVQESCSKQKCTILELLTSSRNLIKKGNIQCIAVRLFLPFICSYYASIEASKSILQGTEPTAICLKLFDLSLNSDVTSSLLKFASYLYCTGQLERTLSVLQDVEERMTDSVLMQCACHGLVILEYPPRFGEREASQQYPTTDSLAFCVTFTLAESHCCPRELQYEMFRSTYQERRDKHKYKNWMDLVVIDSLPYLFFLQYMTFRLLGQYDQQITALDKLVDCVYDNKYLTHRETALNVLGHCMEYEGLLEMAIKCYRDSFSFRSDNNAVRWHITFLMFRLMQWQNDPEISGPGPYL